MGSISAGDADVKLGGCGRDVFAAAGVTAELVSFRNFFFMAAPLPCEGSGKKLDLPLSRRAALFAHGRAARRTRIDEMLSKVAENFFKSADFSFLRAALFDHKRAARGL